MLDDAYVIVVTGAKNAGKTAFGYYLLQVYHERKWRVCTMPYKKIPSKLLPPWIEQTDPMQPELQEGTVYLLDDFHLAHHARTGYRSEQMSCNKIMSIARHLEMKFIITTQITRQLDIANIWDIDIHFLRKPALGHVKAERQDVQSRARTAQRYFQRQMKEGADPQTLVYFFTTDEEGSIEDIPLPEFWTEDLSTYLRGIKRRRRRIEVTA